MSTVAKMIATSASSQFRKNEAMRALPTRKLGLTVLNDLARRLWHLRHTTAFAHLQPRLKSPTTMSAESHYSRPSESLLANDRMISVCRWLFTWP
jgi:hypothetical protein